MIHLLVTETSFGEKSVREPKNFVFIDPFEGKQDRL